MVTSKAFKYQDNWFTRQNRSIKLQFHRFYTI